MCRSPPSDSTYPIADADQLWDGLTKGTVRIGALLQRQPAHTRERIHTAFNDSLASFRNGDQPELPVSIKLAAGRKP